VADWKPAVIAAVFLVCGVTDFSPEQKVGNDLESYKTISENNTHSPWLGALTFLARELLVVLTVLALKIL
jgi:hypothetical protein